MLSVIVGKTASEVLLEELVGARTEGFSVQERLTSIKNASDSIKSQIEDSENGLSSIKTSLTQLTSSTTTWNALVAENQLADSFGYLAKNTNDKSTQISETVSHEHHGLSNLKSILDSISTTVSSINNSTRFVKSVPVLLEKPDSGSAYYRCSTQLFNGSGFPENPDDSKVYVRVLSSNGSELPEMLYSNNTGTAINQISGGDWNGWYEAVAESGIGRHLFYLGVSSSETDQVITIELAYKQEGTSVYHTSVSKIVDYKVTDDISQAVWDVQTSSHQTAGTFGKFLQDLSSSSSDIQTAISNLSSDLSDVASDVSETKTISQDSKNILTHEDYGLPKVSSDLQGVKNLVSEDGLIDLSIKDLKQHVSINSRLLSINPVELTPLNQGSVYQLALRSSSHLTDPRSFLLHRLKVSVSGACSNYSIQILEKTGGSGDFVLLHFIENEGNNVDLNLNSLSFVNRDDTPSATIYIKITNITDPSNSLFSVSLRAESINSSTLSIV